MTNKVALTQAQVEEMTAQMKGLEASEPVLKDCRWMVVAVGGGIAAAQSEDLVEAVTIAQSRNPSADRVFCFVVWGRASLQFNTHRRTHEAVCDRRELVAQL